MSESSHQSKNGQEPDSSKAIGKEQPTPIIKPTEEIFLPNGRINQSAITDLQRAIGNRAAVKLLKKQAHRPPHIQTTRHINDDLVVHGELDTDGFIGSGRGIDAVDYIAANSATVVHDLNLGGQINYINRPQTGTGNTGATGGAPSSSSTSGVTGSGPGTSGVQQQTGTGNTGATGGGAPSSSSTSGVTGSAPGTSGVQQLDPINISREIEE